MSTLVYMTPNLKLDFTSGVLSPIVSLTRSLNTATVINSSGFIEIANADSPRFNYTLNSGGACDGLLIEETRTNIARYSADFANAAWAKTSTGTGVAPANTGNTTLSPDGVTNAQIFQFATSILTDRSILSQTTAGVSNGFCSTSSYLKAGRSEDVGKIISIKETQGGSYTLVTLTNQWQRAQNIATSANTTRGMAFELRPGVGTSTGIVQVAIWGSQVEIGNGVTSYIPNNTAGSVTRNADVATITGTNFSDFWQATRGGASVLATPSTVSGIRPLVQFDDNTANEIIALRGNTTNPELYIVDGGTPQAQLDAGTIAANTAYSLTGWWDTNNCKARQNSGATVSDYTATIPTVTQMRIGSDGTDYLNGTIAAINYYDSFFGQPIYTRRKNKVFQSLI